MLVSDYRKLCDVSLPFANRQRYMHSFDLSAPVMAEGFEDYADVVRSICDAAGAREGVAHMTVDEKVVAAGMSQRRPRPHVDGCFIPAMGRWGNGPGGGWNHYCNGVRGEAITRMPIIVAASVSGCRAWRGQFDGQPTEHGDLSHIEGQLGAGEVLPANAAYLLSPDCVHESMVFNQPTRRSFLRIALPVEYRF